ncbi:hypothetical protein RCH09_003343 [Actimicrobium sp. GrIS 1.19]|uniref:hypothetical protein n=1 Tax=Actimicrobium sp. GrIS 1.19 TaxID=3071708 RepID=UPI002E06E1B1|nr:hypothetical protein [Actimicrobium sp. GrIS 1.19]
MPVLKPSVLFCAAMLVALPCRAADDHPGAATEPERIDTPAIATTAPGPFGAPIEADTLEGYRGGAEQVSNDMTLNGTTAQNTADRVVTGANSIGTGAFSNLSGIPIVIQNSGANVLIQNATIINLQLN